MKTCLDFLSDYRKLLKRTSFRRSFVRSDMLITPHGRTDGHTRTYAKIGLVGHFLSPLL